LKNFYRLIRGDCLKVLPSLEDNSVDCVVTDPPYGINFMGKDWDKALPPKKAFEEVFRVLKPGALAFVMSSPRQDVLWRMLAMLEGVGFELTQSYLEWIYKSGFPKAYDVSKGIDKKLGLERVKTNQLKQGHTLGRNRTFGTGGIGIYGEANESRAYEEIPTSEEAKRWEGWKSIAGLKPAHEPILMVNKPFTEPTIVDNVLRWGVGAINVDECRIPFSNKQDEKTAHYNALGPIERYKTSKKIYEGGKESAGFEDTFSQKGRFPANLLVSDKALDDGESQRGGITNYQASSIYGTKTDREKRNLWIEEIGGKSRYVDLDAWAEHHGFLDVPKASKSEREEGLNILKERGTGIKYRSIRKNRGKGYPEETKAKNIHPTVKPVRLMAYLVTLGCPPNGTVLDPFIGSGTTMIACKSLGRSCIGIEINPEYIEIAKARCFTQTILDGEYSFIVHAVDE